MPDFQIEVIFCPREGYQNEHPPPKSWPRAAGFKVRLTRPPAAGQHDAGPTDDDGIADVAAVAPDTYDVEILDGPPFWERALWTLATTKLTVLPAGNPDPIILFPADERQLLPLVLSCDDPATGLDQLPGARIEVAAGGFDHEFKSDARGRVAAVAPDGNVTVTFHSVLKGGKDFLPPKHKLMFAVSEAKFPQQRKFTYAPETGISVKPVVKPAAGPDRPLVGAEVTLTLGGRTLAAETLRQGNDQVSFERLAPGTYGITVVSSAKGVALLEPLPDLDLGPGENPVVTVIFKEEQKIGGQVQAEDGKPVTQAVRLRISGAGGDPFECTATGGKFETFVGASAGLTIGVVGGQKLQIEGIPLVPNPPEQVRNPAGAIVIKLRYQHAIKGRAHDEQGKPAPGAKIDVFDADQGLIGTVQAGADGRFTCGVAKAGTYFVAQHMAEDTPAVRESVEVHSNGNQDVLIRRELAAEREATTDLSSYPVLTEEITTVGPPGPVSGGPGGRGTDYGQVVDQAMRDVLGWRPGGDVVGFQAALAGAFQLREVQGHTEWTWQQRGYAVQADMGALTGAQLSLYIRAQGALDQILPLIKGLISLNPALYPPQDLEAIRTVVIAELTELVNELALEGGPRIQRVDELFGLLLGDSVRSKNLNPDIVQGQLGTLRERFGLTVAYVDTVEEERIVTNFRIVVEQVLALQASWNALDRRLLTADSPNSSLGTILIWLSRGLEAVSESVSDLVFAMDSVFVDAAQRQVIELRLGGPPLLLSDLLDWIVQACRDEGPRMIQDSGKDGVLAFAPILGNLRDLARRTRDITRPGAVLPAGMRPVPDGLQTPRVNRAFQVLHSQLTEAARLAGLVQLNTPPQIDDASVIDPGTRQPIPLGGPSTATRTIQVEVHGSNIRPGATAVLVAADREGLPEVPARSRQVVPPNTIKAVFPNPRNLPGGAGAAWSVLVINEDGTESAECPL